MIKVKRTLKADTRTCDFSQVSKRELLEDSTDHILDVNEGLQFLAIKLTMAGLFHDRTKISHIDQFYDDFKTGFKKKDWFEMHKKVERHHLKYEDAVQDDVDLIDVLEMIVDNVMAGLARSGEYRKEELPTWVLQKAFDNTVELMLNNIEVVDK